MGLDGRDWVWDGSQTVRNYLKSTERCLSKVKIIISRYSYKKLIFDFRNRNQHEFFVGAAGKENHTHKMTHRKFCTGGSTLSYDGFSMKILRKSSSSMLPSLSISNTESISSTSKEEELPVFMKVIRM